MMNEAMISGLACIILGIMLWGFISPAMIPGATSGDGSIRWQHIAERVSVVSALAGVVAGFGLAIVVVTLISSARIKSERKHSG